MTAIEEVNLDWLPAALKRAATMPEPGKKIVLVDALRASGALDLGHVPPDWVVRVANAGTRECTKVTCTRAGARCAWIVERLGGGGVVLGRAITRAQIRPSPGVREVYVASERRAVTLVLRAGSYEISGANAGDRCALTVEIPETVTGSVVIGGTATVRHVKGGAAPSEQPTAELVIKSDTRNLVVKARLATLVCKGAVTGATVAGPREALFDAGVSGHVDLDCGDLASRQIRASGKVRTEKLRVATSLDGEGSGLEVTVGQFLRVGSTTGDVLLKSTSETAVFLLGASADDARVVVETPKEPNASTNPALESGEPPHVVAVRDAIIDTKGEVHVFGDGRDVAAFVGRSLAVQGDLSVGSSTPVTRLGVNARDRGLEVDEARIGGAVSVDDGAELRVTTALEADAIVAGRVRGLTDSTRVVARCLSGCDVHAGHVHVTGFSENATIQADQSLELSGPSLGDARVVSQGSLDVQAECQATLAWHPDSEVTARIGAVVKRLDVHARVSKTSETPALVFAEGARIAALSIAGKVRVSLDGTWPNAELDPWQVEAARLVDEMALQSGARVVLDSGPFDLGRLNAQRTVFIERTDQAKGPVYLHIGKESKGDVIDIAPGDGVVLAGVPDQERDGVDEGFPGRVSVRGGRLAVDAQLGTLGCQRSSSGDSPILEVGPDGRIGAISGDFVLASLEGRVVAKRNPKAKYVVPRMWSRLRLVCKYRGTEVVHPEASVVDTVPTLRPISRASLGAEPSAFSGQLVGVDVTKCRQGALRPFWDLDVFDPDGSALVAHALASTGTDSSEGRAQRLKVIAESVASRATSGSTYTLALWAAAHAHVLALRPGQRTERFFRFLHSLVGYGYRPLPAIASYLAVLTVWAAGLTWVHEGDGVLQTDGTIPGPYGFGAQWLRLLALPTSVLRLDLAGVDRYAPIGHNPLPHMAALISVGLVLGFVVVATRNYLRTPFKRDTK